MEIYIIIVFGLATIRTITPLTNIDVGKYGWTNIIAQILLASTTVFAYVHLLKYFLGV
jgi:hypothetical protein